MKKNLGDHEGLTKGKCSRKPLTSSSYNKRVEREKNLISFFKIALVPELKMVGVGQPQFGMRD